MFHQILEYTGIAAGSGIAGLALGLGAGLAVVSFGALATVPIAAIGTLGLLVGATELCAQND